MINTHSARLLCGLAVVGATLFSPMPATAQRGMGDSQGVAQMGSATMFKDIEGVVVSVEEGQCAMTTGRASIGAHVILQTADQSRLNLHLGPVAALQDLLDRLTPGTQIRAGTFRTDSMPEDASIARTVTVGNDMFELRDQALRPRWRISQGGGSQQGMGMGQGQGMGQGRGQGMGQGQGRGQGMGQGQGQGQGRGAGPCWW